MDERADGDLVRFLTQQRRRLEIYLRRFVACPETASDLAQDAIVRVWQQRDRLVGQDPGGYLFRTAHNLSIDHLRAQRVRRSYAEGQPSLPANEAESPEEEASARQEMQILEDALLQLPPKTREVFLMSRVHGRTYGEIAELLGISQSGVEKHMLKALSHCRNRLLSNR